MSRSGPSVQGRSSRVREPPAHLSTRAGAGHQQQWLAFSPCLPKVMLTPSRVPEQQEPLGYRKGQRCPAEPRAHLADHSRGMESPQQLMHAAPCSFEGHVLNLYMRLKGLCRPLCPVSRGLPWMPSPATT